MALPSEFACNFATDGFRVIVFRAGNEVSLQSRDERPLNRYFPDLERAALTELPQRCVLDGEVVIERDGVLDFEALQKHIHPAAPEACTFEQLDPLPCPWCDFLRLPRFPSAIHGAGRKPSLVRAARGLAQSVGPC
jgi:hypothetical protein